MNETKTLRQINQTLKTTRRIIQGYEKIGLVKPCGLNKYGHLLYDQKAFDRIVEIRFYQKIGFGLKEIKDFIDRPEDEKRSILITKRKDLLNDISVLEERHKTLNEIITCNNRENISELMLKIIKEDR